MLSGYSISFKWNLNTPLMIRSGSAKPHRFLPASGLVSNAAHGMLHVATLATLFGLLVN